MLRRKNRARLKSLLHIFLSCALIFNSFSPFFITSVYAQDIPLTTETSPTPEPTPTLESTIPSPTESEQENTPTPEPTPTLEITPVSPTATDSPVLASTSITTLTPTSDSSPSIDLNSPENQSSATLSPSLTTDKADYAPNEIVVITGSQYEPNTAYIIAITSTDEPPVRHEDVTTTDDQGTLYYSYPLDGTYRPNYLVEIFLGGKLISSTTFTDSNHNTTTCPDGGDWDKVDGINALSYTYTPPNGYKVVESCMKVGDHDPVYGTGATVTNTTLFNSPAGVTCIAVGVPHNGCNLQNISHASFRSISDPATITIIKDAIPNSDQDFSFSATNIPSSPSFTLDDDDDLTLSNQITFSTPILQVGETYTFTEAETTGWTLTDISCTPEATDITIDEANRSVTIDSLVDMQDITCTFTNVQNPGTIIIEKQTNPDGDQQEFSFTGDVSGSISDGEQIIQNNLAPGQYTVTESALNGWELDDITCTDPNQNSIEDESTRTATINLEDGETVTCVYTNNELPTIEVVKNLVPSNDPGLFDLLIDSTRRADDVGDGGTTGAVIVNPGIHTVGETAGTNTLPTDYTSSYSDNCLGGEVEVDYGDHVVCEITNVRKTGTVSFQKEFTGGEELQEWFYFTVQGVSGQFYDYEEFNQEIELPTGSYTVTEFAQILGYTATAVDGIICQNLNGATATLVVTENGDCICVFTNTRDTGSVTVRKEVDTDGNDTFDLVDQDIINDLGFRWELDSEDNNRLMGDTAHGVTTTVGDTTHTVIEEAPTGYELVGWFIGEGDCNTEELNSSLPVPIQVERNENTTVTFCNQDIAGSATVTKYHDYNQNGIHDQNEPFLSGWEISLTNQTSQQTNENGEVTFTRLLPGEYVLSETLQSGWTQTNISCDDQREGIDNDNSYSLNIVSNQTTTCEIGNYNPPVLEITKNHNRQGQTLGVGELITYTLTVTNTGGSPLHNVYIEDVPPITEYFEYITTSGVVTAPNSTTTNITATGSNPFTWYIADTINPGETYTLSYQIEILSTAITGTHYNFAFAYGIAGDQETEIFSDIVEDPFSIGGGSDPSTRIESPVVNVLGASDTRGQVLGAATGTPTFYVLLGIFFLTLGLVLRIPQLKNKLVKLLPLFLLIAPLFLAQSAYAAVSVDIVDLPGYKNTDNFQVSFNAIVSEGNLKNIVLEYHREGQSWQTLGTFTTHAAKFQVTSAQITEDNKYYFKVTACDHSSNCVTDETSTIIDRHHPPTPESFNKTSKSNHSYLLKWYNPDSDQEYKVIVYRSDSPNFTADNHTQVAVLNVVRKTETEWTNDHPEGRTYYYALRAIDPAGNVSGLAIDPQTPVTTTTTTTTSTGTPVTSNETFQGTNMLTSSGVGGQILGEENGNEEVGNDDTGNQDDDPATPSSEEIEKILNQANNDTDDDHTTFPWPLILVAVVAGLLSYFIVFRRK